jgi:hypothetical protein
LLALLDYPQEQFDHFPALQPFDPNTNDSRPNGTGNGHAGMEIGIQGSGKSSWQA